MRIYPIAILLLIALALPADVQSQAGMPIIRSVEPASGKAGDVLEIQGKNLGAGNVAALYLTDGKNDIKVPVIEQTDTSIKFKIPAEAKPGRFALMVLTKGKEPKLIEQPVKISVEPESGASTVPTSGAETIRNR